MIKEVYDPSEDEVIPRKFISGGDSMANVSEIRTTTENPRDFAESPVARRDQSMLSTRVTPAQKRQADEYPYLPDVRTQEKAAGHIVPGDPKNLDEWQKYISRPIHRTNNNGEIVAVWTMATALADILLNENASPQKPFVLSPQNRSRINTLLSENYQMSNITDPDLGLTINDLLKELTGRGFLMEMPPSRERPYKSYYIPDERRPSLNTWARLNTVIEEDLNRLFDTNDELQTAGLLNMLQAYENTATEDFPLSLVEPYQPFLRAVLSLSPKKQNTVLDFLYQRYFTGESPANTGGVLVDSLMVMFDRLDDKQLLAWAKRVFPSLTQEGRMVYLFAPEITLLKGGLGRVMQYLGRAMHKTGIQVAFVEPRYNTIFEFDENGNVTGRRDRDYKQLRIPLDMPDKDDFAFEFTVKFEGKNVRVRAYKAINDAGMPVYTFNDVDEYYIQDVYYEGPGAPSKARAALFMSKAGWAMMQELEKRRKMALEAEGKPYVPSVVGSNDGQVAASSIFRLIDPKQYSNIENVQNLQSDESVQMHSMVTGHTVLNTLQVQQDDLRAAGIPEDFWWMFKTMGLYGEPVYDATKGGELAGTLTGGAANNVAENHRATMWPVTPMTGGVVYGITNGDLLPLTMREWNRAFMELGLADDEHLELLFQALDQATVDEPDPFKKAALRSELDEFLNKAFWSSWNTSDRATRKQWIRQIKSLSKKKLFLQLLSNERIRNRLNIHIPEGREDLIEALASHLAGQLVKGYAGRGVKEKLGMDRAHTEANLEARAVNEISTIIQASIQQYAGTNEEDGSAYLVKKLIAEAARINQQGYEGKFFVLDEVQLDMQLLLLAAADVIVLDSDSYKLRILGEEIIIPTGASESTEDHVVGLFQGPSEPHGFINLIGTLFNRAKMRGTYFSPRDSTPQAARDLDELQEQLFTENDGEAFWELLLDAVNIFRAIDTRLTASGYGRLWDSKIEQEETRRHILTEATPGVPLTELLKQEYRNRARAEREVSLSGFHVETTGTTIEPLTVSEDQGLHILHVLPTQPNADLIFSVTLNPNGIPEELIQGFLRDERLGNVFPLSMTSRNSDGTRTFAAQIPAEIWREWQEGSPLRFYATGGSWYEVLPFKVSKKLPAWQRKAIARHVERLKAIPDNGTMVDVHFQNKTAEDRTLPIQRNQSVSIDVAIPISDPTVVDRLKLGVFAAQGEDPSWRFLSSPYDYQVAPVRVQSGQALWTITMSPKASTELTVALFDQGEDLQAPGARQNAILWTGKNLSIKVDGGEPASPAQPDQALLGVNRDTETTVAQTTPGGIKLDPALLQTQIIRDGDFIQETPLEIPDEYLNADGFTPVLINTLMTVNIAPLILGKNTEKAPAQAPQEKTSFLQEKLLPGRPRYRMFA